VNEEINYWRLPIDDSRVQECDATEVQY